MNDRIKDALGDLRAAILHDEESNYPAELVHQLRNKLVTMTQERDRLLTDTQVLSERADQLRAGNKTLHEEINKLLENNEVLRRQRDVSDTEVAEHMAHCSRKLMNVCQALGITPFAEILADQAAPVTMTELKTIRDMLGLKDVDGIQNAITGLQEALAAEKQSGNSLAGQRDAMEVLLGQLKRDHRQLQRDHSGMVEARDYLRRNLTVCEESLEFEKKAHMRDLDAAVANEKRLYDRIVQELDLGEVAPDGNVDGTTVDEVVQTIKNIQQRAYGKSAANGSDGVSCVGPVDQAWINVKPDIELALGLPPESKPEKIADSVKRRILDAAAVQQVSQGTHAAFNDLKQVLGIPKDMILQQTLAKAKEIMKDYAMEKTERETAWSKCKELSEGLDRLNAKRDQSDRNHEQVIAEQAQEIKKLHVTCEGLQDDIRIHTQVRMDICKSLGLILTASRAAILTGIADLKAACTTNADWIAVCRELDISTESGVATVIDAIQRLTDSEPETIEGMHADFQDMKKRLTEVSKRIDILTNIFNAAMERVEVLEGKVK